MQYTSDEQSFLKRFRDSLQDDFSGPEQIKHRFDEEVSIALPNMDITKREQLWKHARKGHLVKLLAVQTVSRSSGNGQISLYVGDVFELEADQWICSSFQNSYDPSGGAWISFWKHAGNKEEPSIYSMFEVEHVQQNKQIAILNTNPKYSKNQTRPTIVIHGRFSQAYREFHSTADDLWVEKAYSDALFAIRQLSKQGRTGSRLAMPILFSELHNLDYQRALELQKEFAIDILQREPHIREIMITTYNQSEMLLEAYHQIIDDNLVLSKSNIPSWISSAIEHLSDDIRQHVPSLKDDGLQNSILACLGRISTDTIYLNDIAVLTRTILEKWSLSTHTLMPNSRKKLYDSISKLRSLSGSPNRTIFYIDGLRELGNVGAHQAIAPHPLEKEDLITLLLGIKAILRLHVEITESN